MASAKIVNDMMMDEEEQQEQPQEKEMKDQFQEQDLQTHENQEQDFFIRILPLPYDEKPKKKRESSKKKSFDDFQEYQTDTDQEDEELITSSSKMNRRRKPFVSAFEKENKKKVALLTDPEEVRQAIAMTKDATPFTRLEQRYVDDLEKRLTRNTIRDYIAPVVDKRSVVSLRDLQYSVSSYFPDQHTSVMMEGEPFPVCFDDLYQRWLGRDHKDFFDAFRRKRHCLVVCDQDPSFAFETTNAQLNFFRWALEFPVLKYVSNHLPEIKNHMSMVMEKRDLENAQGERRGKRRPLLTFQDRGCEVYFGEFSLHY